MENSTTKHPLEWFEKRVGSFIQRAPIFASEMNRGNVIMKIKDKNHAKLLFDLQRNGRAPYTDANRQKV